MKKVIIYTALFGAYDSQLIEIDNYDRKKFKFVCFTNLKKLKSNTWNMVYVDDLPVPNNNPKSSRYYKTNPHKLFPENDISIWIDASCNKLNMGKLTVLLNRFLTLNVNLYIEKHPSRNCLYEELKACIYFNKSNVDEMKKQVNNYKSQGMPVNYGMVETGFQIRKHNNKDVIEFQELLWNEILNNSCRDQLAWNYCSWKLGFNNYKTFSFREKLLIVTFRDHLKNYKEKILLVGPWLGENEYEEKWCEYVLDHISKFAYDKIMVGCRPGREFLYSDYADDYIITDVEGSKDRNLINGKVPRFHIQNPKDKEVIQLNPTSKIFNDIRSEKISIIITAYKSQDFIEECLLSIQNQKYFKNNDNYEILVAVDNDKKTLNKVMTLKSKINRLKIYNSTKNVGTYILRNSLVEKSSGKYLLFFDSDDILCENTIKNIITLKEHDYVRFRFCDYINTPDGYVKKQRYTVVAAGVFWISKKIFNKIGGFQPWFCSADRELQIRCKKNKIQYTIVNERYSMYRRSHDNNLSSNNINSITGNNSLLRKSYHNWMKFNKNWNIPITPIRVDLEEK
ncbi:MAG: glycosyltransferase domain-containing protein [bacterium]